MTEIIINLFLGILCGSGAVLVMEMVITASLAFIDLFKERRKKMGEREHQYDHEYYLKNRERILARVKSYYQANKEDIGFCQKIRRNYSQVEHCKMMIKHWERKLREAEKDEKVDC